MDKKQEQKSKIEEEILLKKVINAILKLEERYEKYPPKQKEKKTKEEDKDQLLLDF